MSQGLCNRPGPPRSRALQLQIFGLVLVLGVLVVTIFVWLGMRRSGPRPTQAPPEVIVTGPSETVVPQVAPTASSANRTSAVVLGQEVEGQQLRPSRPSSPLAPGQADTTPAASPSANGRSPLAIASRIDFHLDAKLNEARVAVSPLAGDAEFLRRVSLDLTGKIPSAQKTTEFLASTDPGKRGKLIDELLASEDFGRHFAHYWRDLFAKREGEYLYVPNEPVFLKWMAQQHNQNPQWDRIVRALLTGKGEEMQNGDTYLIMTNQDMQKTSPDKLAATVTTLFMGTQLQCAQCHVHPTYKDWVQSDFWGIAAFFAHTRTDSQLDKKKAIAGTAKVSDDSGAAGDPKKNNAKKGKNVANNPPGTLKIPDPTEPKRTIGVAKAKYFGGEQAPTMAKPVYRTYLADWFASPKNTYFGPAYVNRMWSYFFATGLVNPIDDMRPDNPATHPELLRELAQEFEASDFDIKHLMRSICNSKSYQRSSRRIGSSADEPHAYSHMPVRVLTAHQLFDSFTVALGQDVARGGAGNNKGGKKAGPKVSGAEGVILSFDTRDYDENPGDFTYGIPQVLRLMNRQLTKACDDVARQASKSGSPEQVIEGLYVRALSRRPTPAEVARMKSFVDREGNAVKGYAGVLWALLNSAEFTCNR